MNALLKYFWPSPLARDGVLVVRGLFDAVVVSHVGDALSAEYAKVDRGGGSESARISVRDWGGFSLTEVRDSIQRFIAMVERAVEPYVGCAPVLGDESSIRRHLVGARYVAWHIDADAAGTFPHDPCFNVWVPFVPVGIELPSLQFAVGSSRVMRKIPLLPAAQAERDDAWVRARFKNIISPALEVGDAVIFDHYTLHRTQPVRGTATRMSGEFRVHASKRPVMQDC